jgi:hypothetical protein
MVDTEENVHESVALPEPVRMVGETVQAVLLLVDRLTRPAKPFSDVTVTVEVPALPAFTVMVVGVAAIRKS